jgi:hypothetical protein
MKREGLTGLFEDMSSGEDVQDEQHDADVD